MIFRFASFQDFLQMGGHGPYVWSAYLISIVIMVWLTLSPLLRRSRALEDVARELRRETVRRESFSSSGKG